LICVRIAAVVDVAIRKPEQDDLSIRVITVVEALPQFTPKRELRRDLPNYIDLLDSLAGLE
jgi:hypothetical protein